MDREKSKNAAVGGDGVGKATKRCLVCNKRLGLIGGFTCKCGGMFCGAHRSENLHDCSFNFKDKDVEKMVKAMECQANKVIQI